MDFEGSSCNEATPCLTFVALEGTSKNEAPLEDVSCIFICLERLLRQGDANLDLFQGSNLGVLVQPSVVMWSNSNNFGHL